MGELSDVARCAPNRVLPEDHPIRLLSKYQLELSSVGALGVYIRAISASTKAHIGKKPMLHMVAAAAADALRMAISGLPEAVRCVGDELWHYHNTRSGLKPREAKEKPPGDKPHYGVKDETSKEFQGLSLDEVYSKASVILGIPENELKDRYAHLNSGMQIMNLRNRCRSILKKNLV